MYRSTTAHGFVLFCFFTCFLFLVFLSLSSFSFKSQGFKNQRGVFQVFQVFHLQ